MCGSVFDHFNAGQRIQSDGIWWHSKTIGNLFLHRNNSWELRWKETSWVIPQMFDIKNGFIFQSAKNEGTMGMQEPLDVEMSLARVCLWVAFLFLFTPPGL